jgi:hypothetical protein
MNEEDQDGSESPKGRSTKQRMNQQTKTNENKLTFNLLLLHLEGLARLLSLALQLEVRGVNTKIWQGV